MLYHFCRLSIYEWAVVTSWRGANLRKSELCYSRSRQQRWSRQESYRFHLAFRNLRVRSLLSQTFWERHQTTRKPKWNHTCEPRLSSRIHNLTLILIRILCNTWILSFLESATMMFPSSSQVTPLGLKNSPSLLPSTPKNCALQKSDFITRSRWLLKSVTMAWK